MDDGKDALMKKNLMTVLILALVLVNLVFTAILTFSIVPAVKNANDLIYDVATAIDLDLNAGQTTGIGYVPVADIVMYNVAGGDTLTIGLKDSGDGKDHYCVVSVYISMNSKNEDYNTYGTDIASRESLIKDQIISIISSYTKEQVNNSEIQLEIREEILTALRSFFNSDFIIDVGFDSILCQ